jgi:DNA-binding GntR family transcriptional regulator
MGTLGASVGWKERRALSPRATAWGAYRSIADSLRERITTGVYAPGSALPSEATLCAEYGVARNTLRRALDELSTGGLITVLPGRGRIVASTNDVARGDEPQYRRLAAVLRGMIESGEMAPGARIPSEAELAHAHSIARGTVRQALAALEGAGLVVSVHGKGRFVRER